MRKFKQSAVLVMLMTSISMGVQAAEACKVSMMGRVCFEEGSPEATAAHMKGDAVAEAAANKKKAATNTASGSDSGTKKIAEK